MPKDNDSELILVALKLLSSQTKSLSKQVGLLFSMNRELQDEIKTLKERPT